MTPTIEEVRRNIEEIISRGAEFVPMVDYYTVSVDELQAFAQRYIEVGRKEQQEIDAQYLEGMSDGADECATAIRNNTGE